jgi:rsbT antagonist protein RsbS
MGTRTIISGLSPEIALTLQTMGVELQSMHTALTVEQALEMLGLRVTLPGTKKGKGQGSGDAQAAGDRGGAQREAAHAEPWESGASGASGLSGGPTSFGARGEPRSTGQRPARRG